MRSVRVEPLTALVRDGAGPAVVLVPGVMADAESWLPAVEHIDLPNPVVVVNRRGRAPSGPLGPGYSVRTEIDDLHRLLDHLGAGAHLVGWSYGGRVAVEAATERDDLRSLTLYEPVAAPFAAEHLPALRAATPDGAVEIVNRDVSGFSASYAEDLRHSPAWPVLVRLAAALPDARQVRIAGQGHLAHVHAPDLLGRHITDAVR